MAEGEEDISGDSFALFVSCLLTNNSYRCIAPIHTNNPAHLFINFAVSRRKFAEWKRREGRKEGKHKF